MDIDRASPVASRGAAAVLGAPVVPHARGWPLGPPVPRRGLGVATGLCLLRSPTVSRDRIAFASVEGMVRVPEAG